MSDTMQYHDFLFPHNPQSITISSSVNTVALFCPGQGELVQQLGPKCRTVRCTGSFWGTSFESACADLAAFRQTCAQIEAGLLFIPGLAAFPAYLREFRCEASGDGRILPYTMLFVEAEGFACTP